MSSSPIRSVAIIGAGAAGAAAAAACAAEAVFERIRVFERRETPGGTWIYDHDPGPPFQLRPGKLPPEVDRHLNVPEGLPTTTVPCSKQRYERTPIYAELTTNVPEIAMSFSDKRFPYGPFVNHWVPKQYIECYFSLHKLDSLLSLATTVEDVTRVPTNVEHGHDRWKLTLRQYDPTRHIDVWWQEEFDALILANGHYSVPFVPAVKGLEEYMQRFPNRVSHSKAYRIAELYSNRRVLVIGNSASGHDITTLLVQSGKPKLPVYQSRRSRSRFDGGHPPEGIEWKPVIKEYNSSTGEIIFDDSSVLADIDHVIYCTGYQPSFPFWNSRANGGPLYDYAQGRLRDSYQHTFSRVFPHTLGIIGLPRVLTFRSFEYQAIALARLFAGRSARPLPPLSEQVRWEQERARLTEREGRKFHDILWDTGETMSWLRFLFEFAGLPVLEGAGRCPPVLGAETRWQIENVRKYPIPGDDDDDGTKGIEDGDANEWVVVEPPWAQKE